jgi:hypothetical protein
MKKIIMSFYFKEKIIVYLNICISFHLVHPFYIITIKKENTRNYSIFFVEI